MNPWQQDMERSAAEASLNYVTDSTPGIVRIRKGKGFSYLQNGKLIRSTETIQRIRKLAIPPAWENVWICSDENGHLQAENMELRLKIKELSEKNNLLQIRVIETNEIIRDLTTKTDADSANRKIIKLKEDNEALRQ